MSWNPLHWWDVWHATWREIGVTHTKRASIRASHEARIWWDRFVKSWRVIGGWYKSRQRPPKDLPGCEGFILPDHAPLIPRRPDLPTQPAASALLIDRAPVDLVARSCGKKRRYNTHEDANAVAIRCWYDRGTSLRVYACRVCGGWHLTQSAAEDRMRAGWRPPKISERQQNITRKRRRS